MIGKPEHHLPETGELPGPGTLFMRAINSEVYKTKGENLSEVAEYKIEAAAHSACRFFACPDLPLKEGTCTGVYLNDRNCVGDERLEYNRNQFEAMGWLSFDDQTKVWTHEIGHVILQNDFIGAPWSSELGADFMVGVRAEIQGMPKGNFEDSICKTQACATHPSGDLRVRAIEMGREYARQEMAEGRIPTWESCVDAFKETEYATIDYNEGYYSVISFEGSSQYHKNWGDSKMRDSLNYAEKAKEAKDAHWQQHYLSLSKNYERAAKHEYDLAEKAKQNEGKNNVSFMGTSKWDDDEYNKKAAEEALARGDLNNAKKHLDRID